MGIVYRYIDLSDEQIKYVGIVWSGNRTLAQRVKEHLDNDDWVQDRAWRIEYLKKEITSRTDAEYLEAHYISKFGTSVDNGGFNKSKKDWGESEFIDDKEDMWELYSVDETPVSKWEIETTISKICYNDNWAWVNHKNQKADRHMEIYFDDYVLSVGAAELADVAINTTDDIEVTLLETGLYRPLMLLLCDQFTDLDKFPDVKDVNIPIKYRVSEVDGKTIDWIDICGFKMIEFELKGSQYCPTTILRNDIFDKYVRHDRVFINVLDLGFVDDVLTATATYASLTLTPNVSSALFRFNNLFDNDWTYADVCKRLGDYVFSNIDKFNFDQYIVVQRNALRNSEKYADLPEVAWVRPDTSDESDDIGNAEAVSEAELEW